MTATLPDYFWCARSKRWKPKLTNTPNPTQGAAMTNHVGAIIEGYRVVAVEGDIQAEVSREEGRMRLVRVGPKGGRYAFVVADRGQAADLMVLLSQGRDWLK